MSAYSAMYAGIAGMIANSSTVARVADNISNSNVTAYKAKKYGFKSFVKDTLGSSYVASGVESVSISTVEVQGTIESTSSSTDVAIDGKGMFIVNTKSDSSGGFLYTRQGDFTRDSEGNLVNSSGGYLMGWELTGDSEEDNILVSSGNLSSLSVINVNSAGAVPVATKNVNVAMNLNASQNIIEGAGSALDIVQTSVYNDNIELGDIIYPENLLIDEGIRVTYGQTGATSFTYGGFSNGSKVTDIMKVLGSDTVTNTFNSLREGDSFSISTPTIGSATFSFKEASPDKTRGEFNSLATLSSAINTFDGLKSRITNGRILVAPDNINDGMSIANLNSYNDNLESVNLSTNSVMGHGNARTIVPTVDLATQTTFGASLATTAFTGVPADSGVEIVTDTGNIYQFKFAVTPTAGTREFNNLLTLESAIAAVPELAGTTLNTNQLDISPAGTASSILAIRNMRAPGATVDVATSLGISFENSFDVASGAVVGDGVEINVGDFSNVRSNTGLPFADTDVLGNYTTIQASGLATSSPLFGATAATDTLLDGIMDGDGIEITLSNGTVANYTYRYTTPGASQFNSVTDLIAKIQTHTDLAAVAYNTDGIDLSALGGLAIASIKNINTNQERPSNIATALDLEVGKATVNDMVTLTMNGGETIELKFTGTSSGSGVSGLPNVAAGEFNSLQTFRDAVNAISDGLVTASGSGNVDLSTGNSTNKIFSIAQSTAGANDYSFIEALGLDVSSRDINLKFTGVTQGTGPGNRPDTSIGEFNNTETFQRAINLLANGAIDASFANGSTGNKLKFSTENGALIKYMNDSNLEGSSSFTSNLGLRGVKLAESVGISGTQAGTSRFASMNDIKKIVDGAQGISTGLEDNKLKIYVDDPKGTLDLSNYTLNANATPQSDFLTFFGLPSQTLNAVYSEESLTNKNMASDGIRPHFSRQINLIDSLGTDHTVELGCLKIANNKWAGEVYATSPDEIVGRSDGLLGYFTADFSGEGILSNVAFTAIDSVNGATSMKVKWSNGAEDSVIKFELGNTGEDSIDINAGLRQIDGDYIVNHFEQNGVQVGLPTGIEIDSSGYVTINLSGSLRQVYQLSVVNFSNPNGLKLQGFNLYADSVTAGGYTISQAGSSGAGFISSNALEKSNVETLSELANMIIAQRTYQANSRVVQTSNQLLEDLKNIT